MLCLPYLFSDTNTDGLNFSGRTEHEFHVIFFVFLSTMLGLTDIGGLDVQGWGLEVEDIGG